MEKLDELDVQILQKLGKNARRSFLGVARELKISGATVHERIEKLKESGVLEGFCIRVNPKKTGRLVTAFVGLITSQNKGLRQLIEEVRRIKEIEEAYTVTGKYDFLLKLRATDIDELQTLLTDRISCIPGVIRHETMIAMTTILDRAEPLLGPNVAGTKLRN